MKKKLKLRKINAANIPDAQRGGLCGACRPLQSDSHYMMCYCCYQENGGCGWNVFWTPQNQWA